VYCLHFVMLYIVFIFISSPFMFVFGDDRVIIYTGVDDNTGDVVNA